ncbi:MAG: AMP-binding protein [Actinomycetota bacterium]|nr:AMP-binding protein [Actinomycetota bacterium]
MNLASIIDPHPDDDIAVVSRGQRTTYAQLREQVAAYRGGLVRLGLQPGDRVGILAGTNWYFVSTYLAVLSAGLVAVPVNPISPARALEQELRSVGARAVFIGPSGRAAWGGVDRAALPNLEHVIATSGADIAGAVVLDDLMGGAPAPVVDRADDDLAVLIFTSGTAGSPKAAMLTHGNLRSNLEQVQAHPGRALASSDVLFGVLPLFHIFGLNVVLGGALVAGASVVLVERFDPTSALEAVQTHGITVVLGAPALWAEWAGLTGHDGALATVRLAASGAAKLPDEVADAMERRFGVVVTEGYGLTEASPVVTSSAGTTVKRGSIGVPVPGLDVRLVDADGEDVLVGDAGEIWVRGPNVFAGYWEDVAATDNALTADGWLRTGDIAVVDDDGSVFLVDRAKDLIIVSGFNVFPAEVEEVLLEHPGVEAAAVVGVAHPHSGEAVKAFVVSAPGASNEEDEIIAFCADRLARYKCPVKVMFVGEIPVGPAGKVLRRSLR